MAREKRELVRNSKQVSTRDDVNSESREYPIDIKVAIGVPRITCDARGVDLPTSRPSSYIPIYLYEYLGVF